LSSILQDVEEVLPESFSGRVDIAALCLLASDGAKDGEMEKPATQLTLKRKTHDERSIMYCSEQKIMSICVVR
jgi:hypothetical protein